MSGLQAFFSSILFYEATVKHTQKQPLCADCEETNKKLQRTTQLLAQANAQLAKATQNIQELRMELELTRDALLLERKKGEEPKTTPIEKPMIPDTDYCYIGTDIVEYNFTFEDLIKDGTIDTDNVTDIFYLRKINEDDYMVLQVFKNENMCKCKPGDIVTFEKCMGGEELRNKTNETYNICTTFGLLPLSKVNIEYTQSIAVELSHIGIL